MLSSAKEGSVACGNSVGSLEVFGIWSLSGVPELADLVGRKAVGMNAFSFELGRLAGGLGFGFLVQVNELWRVCDGTADGFFDPDLYSGFD